MVFKMKNLGICNKNRAGARPTKELTFKILLHNRNSNLID